MENLKDELTLLRADHEAKEVNFTHTEASLRSEVSTLLILRADHKAKRSTSPTRRPLFKVS
jgi:hypothetical protein